MSAVTPSRIRYSAVDIAQALDQPRPTKEQAAVIETAAASCLVVAGAGSGKTETMAGRVVWLVANELVRPEQVLGLTFTRKAAAELAARVRRRLSQLGHRGLIGADVVTGGEPTVSTYDAYAGRIVAEHALRLGREPAQRLISQTVAWQYARRAVEAYDGPMEFVQVQPRTVTADVLALAEGLSQHRIAADQLRGYCEKLHALLAALPRAKTQRNNGALPTALTAVVDALNARCQLLPLVESYGESKRKAEVLDFADQMALAADLAVGFVEVAAAERATYRAVLLDEYQDTSHAQLVFLRALFGGAHRASEQAGPPPRITAVGDPSQAIYGWRGASQGTLAAFPGDFSGVDGPAAVLTLGTSFRNATGVLTVANHVAMPLRDGPVSTPELCAREGAPTGAVRCALYPTIDDEATALADHVAAVWLDDAPLRQRGEPTRSIAVLVRAWRQLPRIETALRARDIPLEIVGVGGLLLEPEVVDVVATLRVLADPGRGDALMRLLTGARWRIGPRDIAALGRWAGQLVKARADQTADAAPAAEPEPEPEPDDVDERSIIDALDGLPPHGWLSHDGHIRLATLSGELRALRSRLVQPLPDLVADVIRTTGLDVEVLARGGTPSASRANLDRLVEVAAEFAEAGDDISVLAFLDYLDAAAAEERGLERGDDDASVPESRLGVEPSGARVQLLTVHGAKGLEWDVVCVPGLVDGVFPGVRPADVKGWLTQRGALPWPLRGDRDGLPAADLDASADQADAVAAIEEFGTAVKEHLVREERRLAYVAVTRARSLLLCTGYRWDDSKKARADSQFLVAVRDACEADAGLVESWTPKPDDDEVNPLLAMAKTPLPWPYDPLGDRRPALENAARLVSQLAVVPPDDEAVLAAMAEWQRDVEVLLTERAAREQRADLAVTLPAQLSVSQLVTLRRDPQALAVQLRRPMPMPPAPLARRGTAFHAWLEQRFSSPRLVDIDELPGSADPDAAPDSEFLVLQKAFLRSPWAGRDPVEVEVPFELVVGDTVVRGRIDAVFADPEGGFTVVDWKTGRRPTGADAQAAAVQLAAYRLAWADLSGADVGHVRGVFCYLRDGADDCDHAPSDLLDRDGLVRLLESVG